MPFYPALPEYKPSIVTPTSALLGGITAGASAMEHGARAAATREAVNEARARREAVGEYAKTGDINKLVPVMTPEQAMAAKDMQIQQQIKTGMAASDYFDQIKLGLTWDTYPKAREEAIAKFGKLAEDQFPPPDKIGSQGNFEKWKVDRLQRIAQFRAMPQVIAAQARMDAAKLSAESKIEAAKISAGARLGAAETSAGARVKAAEISHQAGGKETVNTARLEAYREGIKSGKYKPGEWHKFLQDEAQAKQLGKESTPVGQARKKGIEARTEQTKSKTEEAEIKKKLERKLLGGEQPKMYRNPKTGETITEEEYNRRKAAAGGQ